MSQFIPAKALECERQPSCYPQAIRERIFKLDARRGEIRRSDKKPSEINEAIHDIAEEQKFLRGLL